MGQEQFVAGAPSVSVLNIRIGLCCHPFDGAGVDSHLLPPYRGFTLLAEVLWEPGSSGEMRAVEEVPIQDLSWQI